MFTVAVTCALILVTHMSSRFYVVNVVYVLSVNKNPDRKKVLYSAYLVRLEQPLRSRFCSLSNTYFDSRRGTGQSYVPDGLM